MRIPCWMQNSAHHFRVIIFDSFSRKFRLRFLHMRGFSYRGKIWHFACEKDFHVDIIRIRHYSSHTIPRERIGIMRIRHFRTIYDLFDGNFLFAWLWAYWVWLEICLKHVISKQIKSLSQAKGLILWTPPWYDFWPKYRYFRFKIYHFLSNFRSILDEKDEFLSKSLFFAFRGHLK